MTCALLESIGMCDTGTGIAAVGVGLGGTLAKGTECDQNKNWLADMA